MLTKLVKLQSILRSRPYRRALLRYGVAAGVEHAPVLRGLHCQSVIDVGANRGQFSLVARQCFPEAMILAFEPLPSPARQFRRVMAGDARVSLREHALGPHRAETLMHVSRREDSSSLLPITGQQLRIFRGTTESGTMVVAVARLQDSVVADALDPPTLLKLDVQGYELEVLKGCETLLDHISYVYAEASYLELYQGQALADDLIAWLRLRAFKLLGVYGTVFDGQGRAVQSDMLFGRAGQI